MVYVELINSINPRDGYRMRKISEAEYLIWHKENPPQWRDSIVIEIDDLLWQEYSAHLAEAALWQEKICELEQDFYNNQAGDYDFFVNGGERRELDYYEEDEFEENLFDR